MALWEWLFGKKEEGVEVPSTPEREDAWLSSNFTFRWVTRLQEWGITNREYTSERKKRKTDDEAIFALYDALIQKHKKDKLTLQSLHYEKAMMSAELGCDPKQSLKDACKSILGYYRQSKDVTGVVVEAQRDACAACKKNDGWILPIATAEKKQILPNAKCTKKHGKKPFCRCSYGPMKEI